MVGSCVVSGSVGVVCSGVVSFGVVVGSCVVSGSVGVVCSRVVSFGVVGESEVVGSCVVSGSVGVVLPQHQNQQLVQGLLVLAW